MSNGEMEVFDAGEGRASRTKEKDEFRPLMDKLAEIGGGYFRPEDDIVQEGNRIVIPVGMSMSRAAKFLMKRVAADEDETNFVRRYRYRPYDGAVCTWRALKRAFGMVGLTQRVEQSFFGPVKVNAQFVEVPVGTNETESVPWGAFELPSFHGAVFQPNMYADEEMGPLFVLNVTGPRKYKPQIEGIFALVQEELEKGSIYRGKAFDGQVMPDFLDLSAIHPDKVIYGEETLTQLDANIWSVLRYRHELAQAGISRKRSALLHGPYGTGKTLGGFLTAQVAVESGWTFIYARPSKDDMGLVLQTARLYQPACVFFEDLDTVADPEHASQDGATMLLDMFDGITAKGTEILVVLTTNHPDRIHKGMLRPGRLDSVIEIGPLDEAGVERLIRGTVPANTLADDIDWGPVFEATLDMLPAYIKEVADRAYRYALSRTGNPEGIVLTTEDLVHSGKGLQPQLDMMKKANDPRHIDNVGEALHRQVQETLVETIPGFIDDVVIETVKKRGDGR